MAAIRLTDTFSPTAREPQRQEPVDALMVARMRLIQAVAGFASVYIDPHATGLVTDIPLWALSSYSAYSVGLYLLAIYRRELLRSRLAHWADVAWYLFIIALSAGSNSIFYVFFFFSILVASFGWGFSEGIRVTVWSAALFTVIGFATAPHGEAFELNRYLTRTVFLLVLGYMISYWGGCELTFKRRLALLREVSAHAGFRTIDRTVAAAMELLRSHYGIESCVLLLQEPDSMSHSLRRVDRQGAGKAITPVTMSAAAVRPLLSLPENSAALYNGEGRGGLSRPAFYVRDLADVPRPHDTQELLEGLANLLEAEAFASVPIIMRERAVGRLFLTCCRRGRFSASDLDFLSQFCQQLVSVIENHRLVDQLASSAAEKERRKLSRDIHDSTIQPYIGLKLGLDALRRKVAAGDPLAADVESLSEMAGQTITDLRNLVWELKGRPAMRATELVLAIEDVAEKYAKYYGIKVNIEAERYRSVADSLAAHGLQIVTEALSNVRRHTSAQEATVRIATDESTLVLEVENPAGEGIEAPQFTPRSIAERVKALKGRTVVEPGRHGSTLVRAELPQPQPNTP
jgi:signal transduction histidine kinase